MPKYIISLAQIYRSTHAKNAVLSKDRRRIISTIVVLEAGEIIESTDLIEISCQTFKPTDIYFKNADLNSTI